MKADRAPPAARQEAGEVRIIGGQWKRSKLLVADMQGLRPTPDRVRETLFNWLGQDLSGLRCLDAFAGSGALGLEAASRHAEAVLMLEQAPALVARLNQAVLKFKATNVQVVCADALNWMRQHADRRWDVVFLDPPFGADGNEALFRDALSAAAPLLAPTGMLYLESPRVWTDADLAAAGLQVHRQGRAGKVHFHLLRALPTRII